MEGRMIPYPFEFPEMTSRRHGPSGWKDYGRYREWLRDEFAFRCVYCLNREQWMDTRRGYQIDHFVPQKIRPDLKSDYSNLLYLCAACNNIKRDKALPDPFKISLRSTLQFHPDGNVEALQTEGERIIEVLELDDPELIDYRRRKIGGLLSDAKSDWDRFVQEMKFPDNLPDLTLDLPPTNSRAEGIQESWLAKKQRGELPEVY
jgi:hypothetical protein